MATLGKVDHLQFAALQPLRSQFFAYIFILCAPKGSSQRPFHLQHDSDEANDPEPKNTYSFYFATMNSLPLRSNFEEHHVRRRPRCGMMNGPGFVFTSGRDEKKAPYNIQKKETAYNMKIIFSPPNSTHAKI